MDALQIFFRCYWPTFYFICLCLHLTMYILIYHRTGRILTTLRYFLYPATTANFVLATLAFATQVRNVNNKKSMALLCDGFCKFIGPSFCFHCYVLLLTMVTVTGLINLHTLCYRTMSLKYLDSYEADKATLRFSWHYLIPLATLVLSYPPPQNHANVYMETLFLHADYNFEIYKNFGGFANSHHFCMTFNTFALALTTIYVPIIGSYWKNVALKILRSNISSMTSNPSRIMLETLIKGLSLQVLLPLCCYVPVTIVYVWNKYSGTQILISQYMLPLLGSLPCIFDPLLQTYFIMPYRTTVRNFFVCNPLTPISRQARDSPMYLILDQIASIYYPIFFLCCMILHSLLFYLIYWRTTKVLRAMRYFLYPSNFINFSLAVLTFFLQFRNVHNTQSLAIMCQGPCKYLGSAWCFHGYIFILSTATIGGVLNIHTLYYRLITIKYHENLNFRVHIFGLWYSFPILIIILSYIPPIDLDFVYNETLQIHPDYDFSPYLKFGGFAHSHNICATLVTVTLVILATLAPLLGWYWRRETLKILDQNINSLSAQSVMQFRALIHGLGLQIMIPLFCYVPVGFFYIYNKYSGTQLPISQYTLCFMITLPALFDPILQIYFIVPYRRAVRRMMTCGRSKGRRIDDAESGAPRHNTITFWQRRKSSQHNQGVVNNTA